ncbi:MAG: flagellar motor switch protein FliM [Pseudomonadota bacterium]
MATKDILSQDEIDALLHGVDSGDVESSTDIPGDGEEFPAYDLTSQDQLVRGRLPTLELINERFVRYFRVSLFNMIRRPAEMNLEEVKMTKFADYTQGLLVPTSLSLLRVHPLRGTALMVIDPKLIFTLVDNFFGGSGRYYNKIEGRDFTTTELRVIRMIADAVFLDYAESWKPVKALELEYLNHEINPHIAQIVRGSEVVIVNSFQIELDGGGGAMEIVLPHSMIEPIRELLDRNVQNDRSERDKRWEALLREELFGAEVDVNCILTEIDMNVRQLASLKAGDIIPIDKPDQISAQVEGISLLKGSYGQSNGKVAFLVDRFLKVNPVDEIEMSERLLPPPDESSNDDSNESAQQQLSSG